jgi:hypothetical protein
VKYEAAHPYKTASKNKALYILICIFLDKKGGGNKRFWTEQQAFPEFYLLLISSNTQF